MDGGGNRAKEAKDARQPRLAQGSIHIGSESATSRHEIAAFATSFRHSVLASEALRAPGAIAEALGTP